MKKLILVISIFCLVLGFSSLAINLNKKEWKQPKLKEGQTIQEAFNEIRQNRNQKIEQRKQKSIQERKDIKRIEKASRSEAVKDRKEQKKEEKQNKGFDFNKKTEKRNEKKMGRAKASESQIDRLDPRKSEINDLMDLTHENVLLDQ